MSARPAASIFLSLALLSTVAAQAKPSRAVPKKSPRPFTTLSSSDRWHLLHDHLRTVTTVRAIPKSVLSLLLGPSPEDGMADAGKPFQDTDVVSGSVRLPFRRLIWGAISPGYCLVYDEAGGFAYRTEVSAYRFSTGHADLVWKTSVPQGTRFLTLPQLQAEISDGKLGNEVRGDR